MLIASYYIVIVTYYGDTHGLDSLLPKTRLETVYETALKTATTTLKIIAKYANSVYVLCSFYKYSQQDATKRQTLSVTSIDSTIDSIRFQTHPNALQVEDMIELQLRLRISSHRSCWREL